MTAAAATPDDTAPYVKNIAGENENPEHICFADTMAQAVNALRRTVKQEDAAKLQDSHLMMFGLEKMKAADKTSLADAMGSDQNTFKRLEVFGCEWDDGDQASFGEAIAGKLGNVRHFDLDNTELGPTGAAAIFKSLADATGIEKVNLQGSLTKPGVVQQMVLAMAEGKSIFKSLTDLDMKINEMKPECGPELEKLIQRLKPDSQAVKLNLFYNDLAEKGVTYVCNALVLEDCRIVELDLSCNELKDAGAIQIAGMLKKNTSLKKLKLALNDIGNAGGIAIFEAIAGPDTGGPVIKNKTLTHLDISANIMKEEVSAEEREKIKNNAKLSPDEEKRMDELNKKLEQFANADLLDTPQYKETNDERTALRKKLDDVTTHPLVKALTNCFFEATLQDFDFTGMEFDEAGWDQIATALVYTKTHPRYMGDFMGNAGPMQLHFSIVDMMNESNLKIMEAAIWENEKDKTLKDNFHYIDWRRKEEKKN